MGTLVAPGMPAFTVADLVLVKARFNVPDTALEQFQAGQLLPLTVDAFANERFEGHVLSVAPAADPKARSFEVVVAIDNPTRKLRSGMIASIRVAEEQRSARSSLIPVDALVHDPIRATYMVYALEEGRPIPGKGHPHSSRPAHWQRVSVVEGLTSGQRIVESGANLLQPGDAVKEIP